MAGVESKQLFLGNVTVPINTLLQKLPHIRFNLESSHMKWLTRFFLSSCTVT